MRLLLLSRTLGGVLVKTCNKITLYKIVFKPIYFKIKENI